MGNERAAYEAQEEEELKTRMGGYYNASADGGCDAIMDEIHARLQRTIPHVNEVRRRLGDAAAQQYRSDIETLEDRGWNLNIAPDDAMRSSGATTRRCAGRAQELRDVTQLVGMAALPSESDAVEAYVQMIEHRKRFRKERRVELKQRNKTALRNARSFGFWFPYARDSPKWLADPATAELAPIFLSLVAAARSRLAPQRCVMQYVPKRRLTRRAARELLRNIAALVAFVDPTVSAMLPPSPKKRKRRR
jgi:hypothetical protein